jgi:CheY-like chemotaxis protein
MKKLLVVEDDPSMRWLLRNLLRNEYEVTTKCNGVEAFSWLSVQNIPDLIITDINMPLMDGFEFIENLGISGLYKNIPIIVLTGYGDSEIFKRCMSLGVYSYMTKPFNPSELFEKIAFPFVSKMFL